jgi:NAD(P)-dependent dehydrogenase (short-subunit alcohol dehydrogenase family)
MKTESPSKTILIVGASRGLGLGLAAEYLRRSWHVIGTVRGQSKTGLHDLAAKDLATQRGGQLDIEQLDINEPGEIAALRAKLAGRTIDLLFVNAGVANDPAETIGQVSTEDFMRVMLTNALSPMRVVEAFEDLVPPSGSIAVMSSGLGSVADNEQGGWEVYRASKAALNTLMRSFAARHRGDGRNLAVIAPGWVRTDMGGAHAHLSIEESIPRVADAIAQFQSKPGLHYFDYRGQIVRW